MTKPLDHLFDPGECMITRDAAELLAEKNRLPEEFLARHLMGDCGDLNAEDHEAWISALEHGERLFSSYVLSDTTKLWIITESGRSRTTILLPDEY